MIINIDAGRGSFPALHCEIKKVSIMPLYKSKLGDIRQIKAVSGNEKIKKFLFSLGCSEGEQITLISILAGNYIISVKNIRYAIDKNMAKSIELV